MILSYKEAVQLCGSQYRLMRAVKDKKIYKIEDGVYSSRKNESELTVIMKKYPKAILTGESAFYYHGLTDLIPEKYDLATTSKACRLSDRRIHQVYMRENLFLLGVSEKEIDGTIIRIYDKERMLIELLRNKNSLPYDLYKEVLISIS